MKHDKKILITINNQCAIHIYNNSYSKCNNRFFDLNFPKNYNSNQKLFAKACLCVWMKKDSPTTSYLQSNHILMTAKCWLRSAREYYTCRKSSGCWLWLYLVSSIRNASLKLWCELLIYYFLFLRYMRRHIPPPIYYNVFF